MASFSDIARRQTRLRSRPLGKLEGGFSDIVKEKSISKLARLKQKAQEANTKPKPEMPLEAAQQSAAPSPASMPPALEMPPVMPPAMPPTMPEPPTVQPQTLPDPRGMPGQPAPRPEDHQPMVTPRDDAKELGKLGAGPGPPPGTSVSMADTAFGASPTGQAIGQAIADAAKGFVNKVSPIPFASKGLEMMQPNMFGYEPSLTGYTKGIESGVVNADPTRGMHAATRGFGADAPGSLGATPGPAAGSAALGVSVAPSGTPAAANDPGAAFGMGASGVGPGCIIISACTNPYSYEVDVTRAFRDTHLTAPMLRGYYALARKVVPFIERFGVVRRAVKHFLVDRLIDYGEYIMDIKPARERRGSEAVSLGFLRLIGWIGRKRNG